ncbi:hypothetical protein HGRIS_010079 [Hohenbuehelia grisea]|uniref:Thioredoxin-like fold domain-containing protein n=1 Tax=Hohenbuehelia grisea TaxID=104357 RepID=A0ABR3J362_9AGAR
MRFHSATLGLCALLSCVNADYFSEGWKPGQGVSTSEAPAPSFTPSHDQPGSSASPGASPVSSLLGSLLGSGPVASFLNSFGFNVTEKLGVVLSKQEFWDKRVTLITDDNYEEVVVKEPLTEDEERERVWFIVISVTSAKQEGLSKVVDEAFDAAFNESQIAGDLPHVRWGRIDYLNVTTITTKWAVWQAPYLVVLTDRGQSLRFLRPYQLRMKPEYILEFLRSNGWTAVQPWSTAYSPGGSREYIMEYIAVALTKVYNVTVMVPSWMLFIISGGLASFLIRFMHRGSVPSAPTQQPASVVKPAEAAGPAPTTPSSSQGSKRSGIKQRKGGKR